VISIEATTAHLRAAVPWLAHTSLGLDQVPIGIDVHTGEPFCFDPFTAYQKGIVTDPVMIVLGAKGSGKSTLIKSLGVRLAAVGHLIRHIDPKGETEPLARFFGTKPIQPGDVVVNPFDGLDMGDRARMAGALCSAALRRPLTPIEQIAATAGAGTEMALTLEGFAEQISQPSSLLSPVQISERDVRDLAAGLAVLARSSLGSMLFGESTVDIDATAQYLSVDLAGHDDQTMSVLMVAVTGWITGLWAGADRTRPKVVLLDEFWRLLGDRATAEWAKYAFKMSRDHGTSYVAVLQHLGDLRSVDTDTRAIALGLLADAETRVVYRQPPDQAAALGELLGFSTEEIDTVQRLTPGRALWKVGGRSFVVDHLLTDIERPLIDTNQAMGGRQ
jgi:type IV secretory pathway VirB4 component